MNDKKAKKLRKLARPVADQHDLPRVEYLGGDVVETKFDREGYFWKGHCLVVSKLDVMSGETIREVLSPRIFRRPRVVNNGFRSIYHRLKELHA